MNFIKKIFDEKSDEWVHLQFQKFGRGEFKDKAVVKVRRTGNKYTIDTSYEFANEFVKILAEKIGEEKTKFSGAIISTIDLKKEIDFKSIKQFQGVKKYLIEKEMSGKEILDILQRFPKAFFALSFSYGSENLKIKPKSPKSSKAKNKEEAPKPDFCKFVTEDAEIGKSFVFEKPEFKTAEINHVFLINEIIVPDELKASEDFVKMREEAKRKGKILRKAVVDGQTFQTEKEFLA